MKTSHVFLRNFNLTSTGNYKIKSYAKISNSADSVNFTGKNEIVKKTAKNAPKLIVAATSALALMAAAIFGTNATHKTPSDTVAQESYGPEKDEASNIFEDAKTEEKIDIVEADEKIDTIETFENKNDTEIENNIRLGSLKKPASNVSKTKAKDKTTAKKSKDTKNANNAQKSEDVTKIKKDQTKIFENQLAEIDKKLIDLNTKANSIKDTEYKNTYLNLNSAKETNSEEISDLEHDIETRSEDYKSMFEDELVYWGAAKENALRSTSASNINPSNPYKQWAAIQETLKHKKMALVDVKHFYEVNTARAEEELKNAQTDEEKAAAQENLDNVHTLYKGRIEAVEASIESLSAELEAEKAKEPELQAEVEKQIANIRENIQKCEKGEYPIYALEYERYQSYGRETTLQSILKDLTKERDSMITEAEGEVKKAEEKFASTVRDMRALLRERERVTQRLTKSGVAESKIAKSPVTEDALSELVLKKSISVPQAPVPLKRVPAGPDDSKR